MVEMITNVNNFVNGLVWGIPAMVLILTVLLGGRRRLCT